MARNLKGLIRKKAQLRLLPQKGVEAELTIPGEPYIYTVKYQVGERWNSPQWFHNAAIRSLLKCYFRSYTKKSIAIALIVRFYVTPPASVTISDADLRKEKTPALHCYELCDYLIHFLAGLHLVLIENYRQICSIHMHKVYSKSPRTVFQFMRYDHYVEYISNNDPVYPDRES